MSPVVALCCFPLRWRSSAVEHLICNQRVGGSNPSASCARRNRKGRGSGFVPLANRFPKKLRESGRNGVFPPTHFSVGGVPVPGRVGEWLKPADCKSAAPCGLRRFESSPVHQVFEAATRRKRGRCGERGFAKEASFRQERGGSPAEPIRFSPLARQRRGASRAWVAQTVERVLGKDEVTGSIPVPGSRQSSVGGGNSAVESRPSKPMVAGSNPVPRSNLRAGTGDEEWVRGR